MLHNIQKFKLKTIGLPLNKGRVVRNLSSSNPFLKVLASSELANKIAIIDPILKKELTYKEINDYSTLLANNLSSSLSPPKRAIGAFNKSPSTFVISLLAAWKLNKIFVPLSISHSISELTYFTEDSGIDTILTYENNDIEGNIATELSSKANLIETKHVFDSHANEQQGHLAKDYNQQEGSLVLYTSGTTGRPKGVLHTHSSITHIVKSLVEAWQYSKEDRILHFLPLYHMHGIVNKLLCLLYVGGTIEFLPSAKPAVIWDRLAQQNKNLLTQQALTLFMAVPTIYAKMLEHARPGSELKEETKVTAVKTLSKMRLMACGSAALPDTVMDSWEILTGQPLLERYGMTELGMALSNPYQGERRKGYVGQPLPYVQVRIVDESGQVITSPNTPGELQVKGKTVFQEYLNKPEATKDTFDGEWFKTGDVTEVTPDGYYKILGRNSTDIIKSSGYKISALEIEREILSHARVLEVAVVGVPNVELGEIIIAIVALRPAAVEGARSLETINTAEELHKSMEKHLSDKLARYKTPRKYFLVESIPRNHLGKVNKKSIIKDLNIKV